MNYLRPIILSLTVSAFVFAGGCSPVDEDDNPAGPTPIETIIGVATPGDGLELKSDSGMFRLYIDPGAVYRDTRVAITVYRKENYPEPELVAGNVYVVSSEAEFSTPATAYIRYFDADIEEGKTLLPAELIDGYWTGRRKWGTDGKRLNFSMTVGGAVALYRVTGKIRSDRDETLFRFPLNDEEGHYSKDYMIGVDHDPASYDGLGSAFCTNYNGDPFPYCYDGHHGSDFLLEGKFETMDKEVASVYAAADGVVIKAVDGNYDRCHIDTDAAGNISCDGNRILANFVEIMHENGLISMYYHLKKYSIVVAVGDKVECGQRLAYVGSSGISSFPHLHFQVEDTDGNVIDPFAGPRSQDKSYWVKQVSDNGFPAEVCQP